MSAHLRRQLSRALWVTHLLTRRVTRGAQPTKIQWVPVDEAAPPRLLSTGAYAASSGLALGSIGCNMCRA